MESDGSSLDELMEHARWSYIKELKQDTARVRDLMAGQTGGLAGEWAQEVLRYFHSIGGTASTLGLERLAFIGKDNESRLRGLIAAGDSVSPRAVESFLKSVWEIEGELGSIQPVDDLDSSLSRNKGYVNMADAGRILLIDDDVTILKLLESAFSNQGYEVYVCDEPLAAMDMVLVTKPDVVLLDIMMPGCNGYEVLDKLKADPQYSDICVIFLSSMDNMEDKIKGMRAGIDDYITKPFVITEVVTRVEMILRRAHKFKEKLLIDGLTGAYSRHYFNERIKDEWERYKRYGAVFTIVFIDIDSFKGINDRHGHSTGDYVLRRFVSFFRQNLRKSDGIFRCGGEEFILLLPGIDEGQAYEATDRLRKQFSKESITFGGNTFTATFSGGVKEVSHGDGTVQDLVNAADKAMYDAKRAGRNKIVRSSDREGKDREHKKTLLLVDDENVILKLLSDRLVHAEYNVVIAANAEKALSIAAQIHVDAMVLDLILPDMDGMEVCRRIKGNPLTRHVRIVILSKRNREEDIVKGFQCGADDYVVKPFSLAELEARIMRILNRQ